MHWCHFTKLHENTVSWDYLFLKHFHRNNSIYKITTPSYGVKGEICRRMPHNFFSSAQFQRKRKSLVFFHSINFLWVQPSLSGLYFRPENPPPPPTPKCWWGVWMVIRQSDRIACLPGLMGGGMVLRSNWQLTGLFCLGLFAIDFWINAHGHESSPQPSFIIGIFFIIENFLLKNQPVQFRCCIHADFRAYFVIMLTEHFVILYLVLLTTMEVRAARRLLLEPAARIWKLSAQIWKLAAKICKSAVLNWKLQRGFSENSQRGIGNCKEEGGQDGNSSWGELKLAVRVCNSVPQNWKTAVGNLAMQVPQNPWIVIAIKLMVKSRNLFRPEDGLWPCLEDANITQHISLHGEFKRQIRHLNSEASKGRGVLLSRLQNIAEATPPVKNKKLITLVCCEQYSKLFYIFPAQNLLCVVCIINILSTGRGCNS